MERRSFLGMAATIPTATTLAAPLLWNPSKIDEPKESQGTPYHFRPGLDSLRAVPGILLNFIVDKQHTNGAYSIIEGKARKGAEPGLHVHEFEDEAFYMIGGEMIVTIGKEDFHVRPGDYIFLPRKIPHTQKFLTETVHVLIYISPAGLEEYFRELSAPAEGYGIPDVPTAPPSEEMIKRMIAANKKYGISNI